MIVPFFVELCAGLASVSGVLQHGARWKPPISRMGRKTGYALAILRVMGLRPRQRAARYLWAEADGDVAALLAAYTQPTLMREVAEIIRSWIPCPYGPHEGWCARCKGTGRWDARDLWEVLRREPRRGLWAGGGDAGEVATHTILQGWAVSGKDTRYYGGPGRDSGFGIVEREGLVRDLAPHDWPPVVITPDAAISPPQIPPGTVVYMDPPYVNTTGYAADFSREQVCAAAERWAAAGARVYISEGEPIGELEGWHHVEITGERTGQARTFGATREFLTCSHPPAWRPATQNPIAFKKET